MEVRVDAVASVRNAKAHDIRGQFPHFGIARKCAHAFNAGYGTRSQSVPRIFAIA
jgi:hypothetical protein